MFYTLLISLDYFYQKYAAVEPISRIQSAWACEVDPLNKPYSMKKIIYLLNDILL